MFHSESRAYTPDVPVQGVSGKALWLFSAVKIVLRGGEERIPGAACAVSLLQSGGLGFTASEPTQEPAPGNKHGMHWLCISRGNSAVLLFLPKAWGRTVQSPPPTAPLHPTVFQPRKCSLSSQLHIPLQPLLPAWCSSSRAALNSLPTLPWDPWPKPAYLNNACCTLRGSFAPI